MSPCDIDCYDLCHKHGSMTREGHTNYEKPVCDWFGWMFTHDDCVESCEGCK